MEGPRNLAPAAPTGRFVEAFQSDLPCPAPFAKIFLFLADPNHFYIPCRLVPLEGRIAIVTDAGRDAMDAAASGVWQYRRAGSRERLTARRRQTLFAYGKAVWFWHPLLVLNSRRRVGPTGLGQAIFADDGDKTNSLTGESTI